MRRLIQSGARRCRPHAILLGLTFLLAVIACGCSTNRQASRPSVHDDAVRTIHIVSHGWHAGLVIPRSELATNEWLAGGDFRQFRYLEIGWGDDGFYRCDRITAGIAIKAVCWPTPSVMHVVGFNGPPALEFPESEVIPLKLSAADLAQLGRFIDQTFERGPSGQTLPLGPGLYGHSEFYRARGSYYFPHSCNHWTARALREAGFSIAPPLSVTAGCLMRRVRQLHAGQAKP